MMSNNVKNVILFDKKINIKSVSHDSQQEIFWYATFNLKKYNFLGALLKLKIKLYSVLNQCTLTFKIQI